MKKLFILLLLSLLFVSCSEKFPDLESPYQDIVLKHLNEFKMTAEELDARNIDGLIANLDFENVGVINLKGDEQVIIVNVVNLNPQITKALFFTNKGQVVRSNLIEFSNNNSELHSIIKSLFNHSKYPSAYSGKLTIYNILGDIQFFRITENGTLLQSGTINGAKNRKDKSEGKVSSCIDWYLITTYYYSNGSKRTTEHYLFTTCDDNECNTTRVAAGKINCGGGGGSGTTANPSFPAYPQNGDEYEFRDITGRLTLHRYDSSNSIWTVVLVSLSEVVVQTNPLTYSYLLTDGPSDGQMIIGPDDFLYEFDVWSGSWIGEPLVVIDSPDRPISDIVSYLDCFDTNQNATVTIYVNQPKPNSDEAWKATFGGAVVGHTFVSITQGGNVSVFGFYPNGDPNPAYPSEASIMGNDSGESFHVSISTVVSSSTLQQILNYSKNYNSTYNLNSYNCSDFGIEVGNLAGMNLPDSYGSWPGGGGSNPGALGQFIRGLSPSGTISVNTTGGSAPQNNKDAN